MNQGLIRLLLVGTGGMARFHAKNFGAITDAAIVAGVDLDVERLDTFCDLHNIARRFSSLEEAIAWGEFDAALNVTPDSVHHPTTMALLAAGKHVFCEKPLATNHTHAAEMAAAAAEAQRVAMVNLTYRNVPALQKARDLVQSGA